MLLKMGRILVIGIVAGLLASAQEANAPQTRVKVGDRAPDFSLLDQDRQPVRLVDLRGNKTVVLAFFVYAFSPG